jgi:putative glutamine amidotransferase
MHKKMTLLLFILLCLLIGGETSAARPLIGITPSIRNNSIELNMDYVAAVERNGGIAIILAPSSDSEIIRRYVEVLDAAIFSGGPDIPPELYGQTPHHTTKVMEEARAVFEKSFIKAFLDSGKPVLGICLGMQFSNVVCGGSLLQDIPEMVGKRVCHRNGEMYSNLHEVGISRNSLLAEILGKTSCKVISRHHQAISKTGKGLAIVARSADGVVEAIERSDNCFGLFVQWHPESMKNIDPDHCNRIFGALIKAAGKVSITRQPD